MRKLAELNTEELLIIYKKNKILRNRVEMYYKEVTQNYINTIVHPYMVTLKKDKFQLIEEDFEYDRLLVIYIKLIELFELPRQEIYDSNTMKEQCNIILKDYFKITDESLLSYYKDIFLSLYIQMDSVVTDEYILIDY